MRRGLFLLLIVLTALRGLVGPAMAASHAAPEMAALVHTAASVHAVAGHMATSPAPGSAAHGAEAPTPGCHEIAAPHAAPAAAHAGCGTHDAGTGATNPHAACADCDICHTAVAVPPTGPGPLAAASGPAPDRHGNRFASAPAAQAIKPPIA